MVIMCRQLVAFDISTVSRSMADLCFAVCSVGGSWRELGGSMAEENMFHIYFQGSVFVRTLKQTERNNMNTGGLAEDKLFHVTVGPFRRQAMMPQSPQT